MPQPTGHRRKLPPADLLSALLLAVASVAVLIWQVFVVGPATTYRGQPAQRPPVSSGQPGPIATYSLPVTAELGRGVVLISGEGTAGSASGTGIILSEAGLVLTNYHVVSDTRRLSVRVNGGDSYSATLVGRNVWSDVAVLRLERASGLPLAVLADDPVQVGDRVVAVGNGRGAGRLQASGGGVTDVDASVLLPSAFGGYGSDRLTGLIESTAGAIPGYSGGPTFNQFNEVVGVTSAGREEVSQLMTSYSIPIDTAMDIANDIINGRQGEQTRVGPGAWLGVTLGAENVAVIVSVLPESPASTAGLLPGSTFLSFAGAPIDTANALLKALESSDPGEVVEITWLDAGGQAREALVELGTSPTN